MYVCEDRTFILRSKAELCRESSITDKVQYKRINPGDISYIPAYIYIYIYIYVCVVYHLVTPNSYIIAQ